MTETNTGKIVQFIAGAERPLSMTDLDKAIFPGKKKGTQALREELEKLTHSGRLFLWPSSKVRPYYWHNDPDRYISSQIKFLLKVKPLTQLELVKTLKRDLTGYPERRLKSLVQKNLHAMLVEKELFKHPPTGNRRSMKFGTHPPALSAYLKKVVAEYERVRARLKPADISSVALLEALIRTLGGDETAQRGTDDRIRSAAPPVTEKITTLIIDTIFRIDAAAADGALVSIPSLRRAVVLPKKTFDEAILQLAQEGRIWLHRHVDPAQIKPADRDDLVVDAQGNYFMGLVLRN
jgi:hypothetical protein